MVGWSGPKYRFSVPVQPLEREGRERQEMSCSNALCGYYRHSFRSGNSPRLTTEFSYGFESTRKDFGSALAVSFVANSVEHLWSTDEVKLRAGESGKDSLKYRREEENCQRRFFFICLPCLDKSLNPIFAFVLLYKILKYQRVIG